MSNFICSVDSCPVILSSICVIYQGENLIYTGISDGDNLQAALQKIDAAFADAGLGYAFQNGIVQTTPGVPVELGGSLLRDTTIAGNYKLTLAGRIEAARHITTGGTASQFVKGDGTLDSNAYQLAGNYITALTGDGTAVGPGSAALTLATVNANPGTYGTGTLIPRITVDAKGRVTSITTTAIPNVSNILVFEGDVTGSGTTGAPVTLTLATVNTNVYNSLTFLKLKVNAKGLVTGASPVTNLDIEGALGYVPVPNTRTITINGVTQSLQADRSWTIASGVASVTASAPLASTGGANPNISIPKADATNDGYLDNVDWATFNSKQAALNGTGLVRMSGTTVTYDNTAYTPQSRTLTINGTTYDLSANRTWSIDSMIYPGAGIAVSTGTAWGTSITDNSTNWNTAYTERISSASAPLSIASNVISISQASGSTNGYLSSTDWTTFNGKQASGNYITALTGEATATGPGSATVTLSTPAVTGKLLTGVNITGGTVVATDTILQGFGKLQNQINALIGGSIYQGVWNAATNTPTLTSGVGTDGYYYITNVAGNTNLDGITDWHVGDWAIFHGGVWQQVDNTDAVVSVNGYTGAVSLVSSDIAEGATNLYFTNTRARQAISLTTTGSSGAATYNDGTGVLNIPNYSNALTAYVPYTGATANVNLGTRDLTADAIYVTNMTAGDGAIYAGGANLIIANWNAGGVISFRVDGGQSAVTINADKSASFISAIAATFATFTEVLTGTSAVFNAITADYGISLTNIHDSSQGLLVRATDNDADLYLLRLQSSNGATSETWVDRFTVSKSGVATFSNSVTANSFIKSGGTSTQFLKADGSVDSNTYLTSASLSGYVATTGDQTISGTKTFTGFGLFDNTIFIKQDSSVSFLAGYNSIDSDTTGIIFSLPAGNMAKFVLTSLSASRDYTLPNATGTIALTSDIVPYSLPIATASVLGGIKVGSNLSINATTGVLDATYSYTLPTASTTVLGGVKVDGSTITINATTGVISGTASYSLPIATASVLGGVKIGAGVSVDAGGIISVSTNYQAPLSGTGFVKSTAGTISYDTSTYYLASNPSGFITSSGTAAAVSQTVTGTNSAELVRGNMADNDQFRILVGGTASNAGFVEIATADDGNEPIFVRQYTGVFSTLVRTATLLDASGNTSFPGTVTAPTFSGALSGNATTATTATNSNSLGGFASDTYIGKFGNGNGYYQANNWIQVNANTGIFWPSHSGLHLYPNNDGSYGSLGVLGEKNGWRGIHFGGGTGMTLMMNESEFGFHRQSVGWTARFTSGIGHFDISGTAASASSVAWSNVSSKPDLVMYYAGFTLDANTMPANSTGFTYGNNAPWTGPIARLSEGGYSLQLNAAYGGGGTQISYRTRNGDAGTFNGWHQFITSSNIGSQSVAYANYAGYLAGGGYINRGGFSSNCNTDFQNTPAGSYRYNGDEANQSNSPGGTWWFIENFRHSNAGNFWGTQVAWGWEDNANKLATRNISGNSFGGWVYYLNSSNYTSYVTTLTFGGSTRLYTGSDGTRNTGWAYHMDNNTGLHWPNNGWHFYPKDTTDMYLRSGGSESALVMNANGTNRGYIYANSANEIGFLNNGRSWIFRMTNSGDAIMDANYGNSIVGVYASTRFQGVFAMGNAYKLAIDGTSPGNLYGLSWSHPNAGGQAGYLNDHGLLVMVNGLTYSALSSNIWARGRITATADVYSEGGWFYSYNNAGWYNNSYGQGIRPAKANVTYGSIINLGENFNGYGGYAITNNYNTIFMQNSGGDHGFFRDGGGGGWSFFYHQGYNCAGIGTDATDPSYSLHIIKYGGSNTGWIIWSDRRIKENIKTIDNALDKVLSLRGVYYNKIDDPNKERCVGYIAQEVMEVVPELVVYSEELDMYNMNYGPMVGMLTEAVKEHHAKTVAQQAEIDTLKQQVQALLNHINNGI